MDATGRDGTTGNEDGGITIPSRPITVILALQARQITMLHPEHKVGLTRNRVLSSNEHEIG